jgi:hypothetical protein
MLESLEAIGDRLASLQSLDRSAGLEPGETEPGETALARR